MTKPVLLLVAFTLSMVLFLYVQSQTMPLDSDTFKLVVHSKNLANGLIFDEENGGVDYTATGPRDKISRLRENPQLASAVADLGFISPGTVRGPVPVYKVRLVVQKQPELEGVEFNQLQRLDGVVERQRTREVKIKVEFPTPPTPNAWSDYDRDSFEVIPDEVALTGSSSDVSDVSLSVVVNPQEAEENGIVRVRLSVPHNLVSTPRVEFVEVHPTRRERQAYVNVAFSGHLPAGFIISNYYVKTPTGGSSTTAIRGPSGIVDKTASIDATVDISGLKKGFTFTAVPKMPRKLELVDSSLQIRVDVEKTRP